MSPISNVRLNGTPVAVFPGEIIHNGNETIYSNTSMNSYLGTIEFDYAGDHITLGDGCEYPIWTNPPELKAPRHSMYGKYIGHLLKDGDFEGLTTQNLSEGKYWELGPWPDINETHATGSGRIFVTSVPGILQFYQHWYTGEDVPQKFTDRDLD